MLSREITADVVRYIRKTASYAVHPVGAPGLLEISCKSEFVAPGRKDELLNADYMYYTERLCPTVSVQLGPFDIDRGLFVDCTLRFPPGFALERGGGAALRDGPHQPPALQGSARQDQAKPAL